MVTKEELMDRFWKIYDNDNKMEESEKDERRRLFQYLCDGVKELYKPIALNAVTNDTFKTCMFGCGINVEFLH